MYIQKLKQAAVLLAVILGIGFFYNTQDKTIPIVEKKPCEVVQEEVDVLVAEHVKWAFVPAEDKKPLQDMMKLHNCSPSNANKGWDDSAFSIGVN